MNVKRIMRSVIFRKNSLADQPTGSRVHALGDRPTRDWIRMVTGLAVSALLGSVAMTYPQPLDAASPDVRKSDVRMSRISGDPAKPRRHFRLREPAVLDPVRASELYTLVEEVLQRGYTRSGNAVAKSYRDWRRYNRAPYLSTTHGNHYLSNYANPVAEAYGRFENAGTLPQGSILAKDSFSVTIAGSIVLGPLFIMEKMAPGFNPSSGDWKYALVMPDGTFRGQTGGPNGEQVQYCIGCHLNVEQQDHLFFVPPKYRIPAP